MKTRQLVLAALFCALMVLGAYVRVPVPGVGPVTLQVFFALLCAFLLPPSLSLTAMLVYTGLGIVGLPVFTFGGGFSSFVQPTFGFIIGMAAATPIAGYLHAKLTARGMKSLLAFAISGSAFILINYIFGAAYGYLLMTLVLSKEISLWSILWGWCLIYVPFDALKLIFAMLIVPAVRKRLPAMRA